MLDFSVQELCGNSKLYWDTPTVLGLPQVTRLNCNAIAR